MGNEDGGQSYLTYKRSLNCVSSLIQQSHPLYLYLSSHGPHLPSLDCSLGSDSGRG